MNFEKDRIYHVYNQGNNRKKIFLTRSNYQLFHKKMNKFICPYADILAWCLMPNHFHLMVYVRDKEKYILNNSEPKGKKIRYQAIP